jgi:hypothetical protein
LHKYFFCLAGEEQAGPSSSSFGIPDKDLFLPVDGFHYDDPESPGIGPDIRNIYLFGKYQDFTYRKENNPNGQLQSTTVYLRGK